MLFSGLGNLQHQVATTLWHGVNLVEWFGFGAKACNRVSVAKCYGSDVLYALHGGTRLTMEYFTAYQPYMCAVNYLPRRFQVAHLLFNHGSWFS